jgi:integrase
LGAITITKLEEQVGGEEASRECPNCRSKKNWKNGVRETNFGSVQRFLCRDCGFRFSEKSNIGSRVNRGRQLSAILKEAKKLDTATETKTVAGDKGRLLEYAWAQKKRGKKDSTIEQQLHRLKQLLDKGADLNNPDSVETVLATETFTIPTKERLVQAYSSYTKVFKIAWTPIKTGYRPKQPYVPLESQLDQIIASSGPRYSAFWQMEKETGARVGEACKIKWDDINEDNKTIRINEPEKRSNSRTVKVSEKTIAMLKRVPRKYGPYVFSPQPKTYKNALRVLRNRLAEQLQDPRFKLIHPHIFRHFKGTTEYAKTKDLLHVMQVLGHRNIQNTLIYTHLAQFESDEFHHGIAKTIDEAAKLVDAGFEFVCDFDGEKLFRKRK